MLLVVLLYSRLGGSPYISRAHAFHLSLLRVLLLLLVLGPRPSTLHAQTVDDGLMMAKRELLTGNVYTHDSWDKYWEGTLKRQNGNIGRSPPGRTSGPPTTASPIG